MKKGGYIKTKENGKYTGQDMRWTERMTKEEITVEDIKAYHYSDRKLSEFCSKETCFFDSQIDIEGFVYSATIPAGTEIRRYDNEIRVEISPNFKIRYIGKITFHRDYTEKGRCGNPYITIIDNTIN